MEASDRGDGKPWTFLTNHARVLICVAQDPKVRIRDIAAEIGITERSAQLILSDLQEAGYLTSTRVGRRNTYTINPEQPFRHPAESSYDVQALINLFTGNSVDR